MIIIAALIAASGFFSLFKQALQAARKSRLQKDADDAGKRGGLYSHGRIKKIRHSLEAINNQDKYLAAARFWISLLRTVAAILAGLSMEGVHQYIQAQAGAITLPIFAIAYTAAFIIIVQFFSGFVPGFLARLAPETVLAITLPVFKIFALPLFFAARIAGKRLRLIYPFRSKQTVMTEDELRTALMEGEKSGIVESKERTMGEGVFYLGDRSLGAFMTHRSEIEWLDINDPPGEIRAKALEFRKQRCFPVADGTLDAIIGAAYLEDIVLDFTSDSPMGLRAVMKKALFAPETMPALKAFETFRRGEASFIFVMDEYGGFAGMVWVQDLMEEIVGELASPAGKEEQAVLQADGSWIADGALNIDDAANLLSLPDLAGFGDYHTLAGFVLSVAEELPKAGDSFTYGAYHFTVLEMDGNRIDKIKIRNADN
jgi:putative hemolysin